MVKDEMVKDEDVADSSPSLLWALSTQTAPGSSTVPAS